MSRKLSKRRRKLWEEDPHCRRCGILTILPEVFATEEDGEIIYPKKFPENVATIQHLDSRLSEERGTFDSERTTLFCWRCNNDDNKEVQERTPKSILRKRSNNGHCTRRK